MARGDSLERVTEMERQAATAVIAPLQRIAVRFDVTYAAGGAALGAVAGGPGGAAVRAVVGVIGGALARR
ncbi:MAG: hypothetical protein WD771_06410 [Gemmatimonadaceae bacterium]